MNTFHSIWLNEKHWQQREERFSLAVQESALSLWNPQDAIFPTGMRILIGVATYSEYDMRLLDLMDQFASSQMPGQGIHIDVFSLHNCNSPEEIDSYIPNMGPVVATPIVGVWSDGVLINHGSGSVAREKLLVKPFDLDWNSQRWCWEHLASK